MNEHQNLNIQENIDVKSKLVPSRLGKRNRGAAMIVVVCVMAVVMILSLTLLLAAYQMFATVNDEGRDELYYRQAISFSEVVRKRLESNGSTSLTDELIGHIDDFMKDTDKDTETLKADAPATVGVYGGITVTLDKATSKGYLIVTVSVDDGKNIMASCTAKYSVKGSPGAYQYTFKEYY